MTLTTPLSNPVIATAAGRFPEMFMAPGVGYDLDITTSAGVSLPGYPAVNLQSVPLSAEAQNVSGTMAVAGLVTQFVYLSDGSGALTAGSWYLADADFDYASTLPQVGVLPAGISAGAVGTIQIGGRVTGFLGLTIGAPYYLSATAGAITTTAPARARYIGQADTATSLILSPNPPVVDGRYSAYTPTGGNTGGGFVLGNGSLTGEFARRGDIIDFSINFVFGATGSPAIGAGTLTFTLPVAAASNSNFDPATAVAYDDSAATFYCGLNAVKVAGSTTVMQVLKPLTGGVATAAPFTWATNDRLAIRGTYRAAA